MPKAIAVTKCRDGVLISTIWLGTGDDQVDRYETIAHGLETDFSQILEKYDSGDDAFDGHAQIVAKHSGPATFMDRLMWCVFSPWG